MNNMNYINNIGPIDNRYSEVCDPISDYLSDFGMNKIRCEVEIKYFLLILHQVLKVELSIDQIKFIEGIYKEFSEFDFIEIKNIEKKTNHDIKALEYFIKEKLKSNTHISNYSEFVHFALTSQDVNSITNTVSINRCVNKVLLPNINTIIQKLFALYNKWKNDYMMSRTHGQPAVTTSMGKEIMVFVNRLKIQYSKLLQINYTTKIGGAVGNLNAHVFCYEDVDWEKLLNNFVFDKFGIQRNEYTTQIDNYDNLCEVFDIIKRVNTILLDMNQDIWLYIMQNYFKLKVNNNETGSSTMPHKVNPINFENSEGNIYLANSLLSMFSYKLPVSRLQRDLTDSTITRNIGVAFSYCLIAYNSVIKGIDKLELNKQIMNQELYSNYSILMEAVQCIMKTEFIEDSYEIIKQKCRGKEITKHDYLKIVEELPLSEISKNKLRKLTPYNYVGILDK